MAEQRGSFRLSDTSKETEDREGESFSFHGKGQGRRQSSPVPCRLIECSASPPGESEDVSIVGALDNLSERGCVGREAVDSRSQVKKSAYSKNESLRPEPSAKGFSSSSPFGSSLTSPMSPYSSSSSTTGGVVLPFLLGVC